MNNFFISRPIFAISLAIALVLLGLISISNLAIEQYPDITPPVVEVTGEYYGADAQTVNNSVATPIGQSVIGVSDMAYMQSTSANDGSMTLQIIFDIGSNPDINTILTQNRVASVNSSLPESVVQKGVTTRKSSQSFLMVYSLFSSNSDYNDNYLTNYAQINLEDELLKINGVSNVVIMGSGEYAMRIWLDPNMVKFYNLSLDEITQAISVQGGIYPAGKFGSQPTTKDVTYTYTVTLPAQINSAEEFGDIIIRSDSNGEVVKLSDIAKITLGSVTYDVKSNQGEYPSALIIIYQAPGSNAIEVGNSVKAKIAELSKKLPNGLECQNVVDTTTSVKSGIKDIFRTLLIALALVIFIIYLFLQSWRATIIPLIAIPVSLIGAFILFPVMGFTINIISLLGLVLAIGLVVDDAIIVVEAVQVNISKGLTPKEATKEAMKSVTSPIIATTVVLLAVFIPVSFIGGVSGMLYQQFGAIISLSVVISAFNALTLSPALCSIMLRGEKETTNPFFKGFNNIFHRSMQGYSNAISYILGRKGIVVIFIAAIIIAMTTLWRTLPLGFLPEEDQGYLMVMVETPVNSSLGVTEESMQSIDMAIKQLPEVDLTCYATGFNLLANISSTNSGIIFVKLVDYSKRDKSAAEIAQILNEELYFGVSSAICYAFIPPAIPGLGLTSGVTFQVQDLEGRGTDYLYGQTLALMDSLKNSSLVANATTQFTNGVPQREIVIDKEQALNLGVNLSELYVELGTLLGSSYISNFNRFGRQYQTYIQADGDFRSDSKQLENYYISSRDGVMIPITSFVTIKEVTGVEYISQFNLYQSIGVTVTPSEKATSQSVMELIEQFAESSLPPDIGIAWSGVSLQQKESSKGGNLIYFIILIFVFLTLAALYNSWRLPLSVIFALPLALMGALLFATVAHSINRLFINDVYMQISLVMLLALAAKNAILVVGYGNKLVIEQNLDAKSAAIQAAKLRVRPIIMTAFAFIFGVMPLIFASGVYATARNIIGIALVGGMVVATLFGIYLYPSLYFFAAKKRNKQQETN